MFQWYEYIAALFVPSIATRDVMIEVEALTNFTKQALLDGAKAIQALNEEQIQMRKAFSVGDPSLIPEWGRSPGEGNGNPFQYSSLENPMDRGACWATVHGVAKSLDMT